MSNLAPPRQRRRICCLRLKPADRQRSATSFMRGVKVVNALRPSGGDHFCLHDSMLRSEPFGTDGLVGQSVSCSSQSASLFESDMQPSRRSFTLSTYKENPFPTFSYPCLRCVDTFVTVELTGGQCTDRISVASRTEHASGGATFTRHLAHRSRWEPGILAVARGGSFLAQDSRFAIACQSSNLSFFRQQRTFEACHLSSPSNWKRGEGGELVWNKERSFEGPFDGNEHRKGPKGCRSSDKRSSCTFSPSSLLMDPLN